MQIPKPLIKLPLAFDADRLVEEISQFGDRDWQADSSAANGNATLALISAPGGKNLARQGRQNDFLRLNKTPYIRQLMASFHAVIDSAWLQRVAPGNQPGRDPASDYPKRNRLRVYLPISTDSAVTFRCGAEQVQMAAGESWTFDHRLSHVFENRSNTAHIYLVIDTVVSSALWRMIDGRDENPRHIVFDKNNKPALRLTEFAGLAVMPASELAAELEYLISNIVAGNTTEQSRKQQLITRTDDFILDWHSQWLATGPTQNGLPCFEDLLVSFKQDIGSLGNSLTLPANGTSFIDITALILDAALNPEGLLAPDRSKITGTSASSLRPTFDRPVFIVAAPRSGSTMLFETLAVNRDFWSLGDESHKHFERIVALRPSGKNPSNRLTAEMATEDVRETLIDSFVADLLDADGKSFSETTVLSRPREIRFLEKTPKNALRIPFILKVFPDAQFIFLFRDARQNLSSLLETWRSQKWVTYPKLPNWPADKPWSHLLIPGWQDLHQSSLAEIVARQWLVTNQTILGDLQQLPAARWCAIDYDSLLANTKLELRRLCHFSDVVFGPRLAQLASQPLKHSKYTLSAPRKDKWRINEAELEPVLAATEPLMARLRELNASTKR